MQALAKQIQKLLFEKKKSYTLNNEKVLKGT